MSKKPLIKKSIVDFYNQASEETRLDNGMGFFEFERIKSLIDNHLTKESSTILDIGGGTGKYSAWLSNKGHKVHLLEPVEKHVTLAKQRSKKLQNPFAVTLGESCNLPFENDFADLVILHGPLYHLQNKEDRLQTIAEAKRVLKKEGIVLGFAINSAASTVVGLLQGLIHQKTFLNMCVTELSTGIHKPPKEFPWLLVDAYYHKPEELKLEFVSQNFFVQNLFAVEGMIWLDKDYFANMLHPQKKKNLTKLLEATETNESILAFSPHMMLVAKK